MFLASHPVTRGCRDAQVGRRALYARFSQRQPISNAPLTFESQMHAALKSCFLFCFLPIDPPLQGCPPMALHATRHHLPVMKAPASSGRRIASRLASHGSDMATGATLAHPSVTPHQAAAANGVQASTSLAPTRAEGGIDGLGSSSSPQQQQQSRPHTFFYFDPLNPERVVEVRGAFSRQSLPVALAVISPPHASSKSFRSFREVHKNKHKSAHALTCMLMPPIRPPSGQGLLVRVPRGHHR